MKRPLIPNDIDTNSIIDLSLIAFIQKDKPNNKTYSIEFYTNNEKPFSIKWWYATKQSRDEEFNAIMTYLMEDHN